MWDLKFPDQGSNLCPLHWNCRVLTTGLPGKSPSDKSFRETSSVLLTNQRSKGSTGFPWWLSWKRARLPLHDMQETWVSSLGGGDPLEEGVATHPVVLTWRIPWTEEPGGLQSMGLQRVGHVSVAGTFIFHESES